MAVKTSGMGGPLTSPNLEEVEGADGTVLQVEVREVEPDLLAVGDVEQPDAVPIRRVVPGKERRPDHALREEELPAACWERERERSVSEA